MKKDNVNKFVFLSLMFCQFLCMIFIGFFFGIGYHYGAIGLAILLFALAAASEGVWEDLNNE